MTLETCPGCGGCGSDLRQPPGVSGVCPVCKGKGYRELMPVIDAELVQKKKVMPYRFRNMTIKEVPIGKKPRNNPCTETYCEVFRYGDCPGLLRAIHSGGLHSRHPATPAGAGQVGCGRREPLPGLPSAEQRGL
jgi:hypothetical protein